MNDWIEINIQYDGNDGNSFSERNLNKPGTLIRLVDGHEYLIGDINTVGGTCDDCTAFPGDTIVKAYKVVWSPENHKPETVN